MPSNPPPSNLRASRQSDELADAVWNRCESMIAELERESHSLSEGESLSFDAWIQTVALRIKNCCDSQSVSICLFSQEPDSGINIEQVVGAQIVDVQVAAAQVADVQVVDVQSDQFATERVRWIVDPNGSERCQTASPVTTNQTLKIEQVFPSTVAVNLRRPVEEAQQSINDILVASALRFLLTESQANADRLAIQNQRIENLFGGSDQCSSLHQICVTIADWFSWDRVSIVDTQQQRVIASSVRPSVDDRSPAMHALAQAVCNGQDDKKHYRSLGTLARALEEGALGDGTFESGALVDGQECPSYGFVHHSIDHVQAIAVNSTENITTADGQTKSVSIVFESFDQDDSNEAVAGNGFDADRFELHLATITRAVQIAMLRRSGLTSIRQRALKFLSTRRLALSGTLAAVAIVLTFLPVPFQLRVPGTVQPAMQRAIFASHEGSVSKVYAADGESVGSGDPLIMISSPHLDQLSEQVMGELTTARAKQAAIQEQRRSKSGLQFSSVEVVKAEIKGLLAQQNVLRQQRERLTIRSPIKGTVRFWDKDLTLLGRPVVHGQRLMTVVSADEGYELNIQIPDHESAYLPMDSNARQVDFHLASNPGQTFRATIDQLEDSAIKNADGKTVINARCLVSPGLVARDLSENREGDLNEVSGVAPGQLAPGQLVIGQLAAVHDHANAIARVHCGKRSAGFVLFRQAIQWFRSQEWF